MKESVAWPYARTEVEEAKRLRKINKELMELLKEAVDSLKQERTLFVVTHPWINKAKFILNKES